jgi:hypothetical protein
MPPTAIRRDGTIEIPLMAELAIEALEARWRQKRRTQK